jgi:hypothetical protein
MRRYEGIFVVVILVAFAMVAGYQMGQRGSAYAQTPNGHAPAARPTPGLAAAATPSRALDLSRFGANGHPRWPCIQYKNIALLSADIVNYPSDVAIGNCHIAPSPNLDGSPNGVGMMCLSTSDWHPLSTCPDTSPVPQPNVKGNLTPFGQMKGE